MFATTVRALVRRVAFAVESGKQADLVPLRQEIAKLIAGIDPDLVDRESEHYRYGACDVLSALIRAIEEQTLPESTEQLLLKKDRARVLNVVLANPGQIQASLAKALRIPEPRMTPYITELVVAGLLEPARPRSGRGNAWSLTPWGRKAWDAIESRKLDADVPEHELAKARFITDGKRDELVPLLGNRPRTYIEPGIGAEVQRSVMYTTSTSGHTRRSYRDEAMVTQEQLKDLGLPAARIGQPEKIEEAA